MYIHFSDNQITLRWTVFRGVSRCPEDFSRAKVVCLLCSHDNRFPAQVEVVEGSQGQELSVTVPANLPDGVYDAEAVWTKNGGRCLSRSRLTHVFAVTHSAEEATDKGGASTDTVLRVHSSAGTYGYDGLSAYETALLKGMTTKDETRWVAEQIDTATERITMAGEEAVNDIEHTREVAVASATESISTAKSEAVSEAKTAMGEAKDAVVNGVEHDITAAKEAAMAEIAASESENSAWREALVDWLHAKGLLAASEKTITPTEAETCNAYYRTAQARNFCADGDYLKRLTYFPRQAVRGGTDLTVRYTGRNAIVVYELPWVSLGQGAVGAVDTADILYSTSLPSNTGESYTGEVTIRLRERTRRVAFVLGSTTNTRIYPSEITSEITGLTLTSDDETALDYLKPGALDGLDGLEPTVPGIGVVTNKFFQMAATGVISAKGTSTATNTRYRVYYTGLPLPKGTRVRLHGETDGTARAVLVAWSRVNPASLSSVAQLTGLDPYTLPQVSAEYDEDGACVRRVYEGEVTAPEDGVWLVYYRYLYNWVLDTWGWTMTVPGLDLREKQEFERLRRLLVQSRFDGSDTASTLPLLHFSDIHGDEVAAREIKRVLGWLWFYPAIQPVSTGDMAYYTWDSVESSTPVGADWWRSTGLAERSLACLGNHDAATSTATEYDQKEAASGGMAWNGKGQQWAFDTYFADYAAGLGVTLPDGWDDGASEYYKACYWHKDYAAQKVRVIALDAINRFDGVLDAGLNIQRAGVKKLTAEQERWFAARLDEAKSLGYGVVVLCHYPLDGVDGMNALDAEGRNASESGGYMLDRLGETTSFNGSVRRYTSSPIDPDQRFCLRDRVATSGTFNPPAQTVTYKRGETNNFGDILQRWIDGGGHFIVWLAGHHHADRVFYPTRYPGVLNVLVTQAGAERGDTLANRPTTDPWCRLRANLVVINTASRVLSLIRVGGRSDRFLNRTDFMCIDYANRRVVSQGV